MNPNVYVQVMDIVGEKADDSLRQPMKGAFKRRKKKKIHTKFILINVPKFYELVNFRYLKLLSWYLLNQKQGVQITCVSSS